MSNTVIPIGVEAVAWLVLLMGVAIALSLVLRLRLARDLAWGTARSTVQLGTVGFAIGWVFQQNTWYGVLGLLALMTLIAGVTASRRSGLRLPWLPLLFTVVLAAVTALVMAYLTQVVLGVRGWEARYWIPLGGMLLGNAMNAATLAAERLAGDLRRSARDVEVRLALGASVEQAAHPLRRAAIRAALMPSINGMLTVGVVTLPGMMTGQMLGGTDPFQAAMYQLMILFAIVLCALLAASASVYLLSRRFFTPHAQLRHDRLPVIEGGG